MKLIKPNWERDEDWTLEKQFLLLKELKEDGLIRSLTKEEKEWLKKMQEY